jgi:hypothetical protein
MSFPSFLAFGKHPFCSGAAHSFRLLRSSCLDLPDKIKHYKNEAGKQKFKISQTELAAAALEV